MDYKDILSDLRNLEKQKVELKSSFSDWDDIGKIIAAFSTKEGGRIYVGVDNTGVPIGTPCGKDMRDRLMVLARTVNPSAIITTHIISHDVQKDLHLCCIEVLKGTGVYSYKNVPLQRRDGINHPLTSEEVFEIQKIAKKVYFDDLPAVSDERPALITDIDESKVRKFLQQIKGIEERVDLRRFLQNQGLLWEGSAQVKNAAVMLFGKDLEKFIPQVKVSIAEFSSTEVTENFIKTEIQDDLITLWQRVIFEIEKRTPVYSFVKGFSRVDVPEYPPEAIREAIANAIVHRDYFDHNTEIFIKIFKDRLEILNPGGFPFQGYTWEEIEKSGASVRRNQIIANFFERYKLMEQEGRGLSRIKQAAKQHGLLEPKIEVTPKFFKITFYNAQKTPTVLQESPYRTVRDAEGLNDRQLRALELIKLNNITLLNRSTYMRLLSVNEKTASRDLQDFDSRGLMKRQGLKRGAHYIVMFE